MLLKYKSVRCFINWIVSYFIFIITGYVRYGFGSLLKAVRWPKVILFSILHSLFSVLCYSLNAYEHVYVFIMLYCVFCFWNSLFTQLLWNSYSKIAYVVVFIEYPNSFWQNPFLFHKKLIKMLNCFYSIYLKFGFFTSINLAFDEVSRLSVMP